MEEKMKKDVVKILPLGGQAEMGKVCTASK